MKKLLAIAASLLLVLLPATAFAQVFKVNQGGSGWGLIQTGALLYGNGGISKFATTTQGTGGQILSFQNGIPTWVGTTTFSTGLSYSGGVVTNTGVLSNAGDWAGTWQTFSPSHFQVAGSYLTSAITGLKQTYGATQTGATQTLATSSETNLGLTITTGTDTHTFTPMWIGTLADGRISSAATWNAKQAPGFQISTSSTIAIPGLAYFTGVTPTALGSVATGTVSAGSTAITVTSGRSAIGGALAIDCTTATGSQNGCLSSTDWSTFNGKQAAGNYITALTGDILAAGPGSAAATIQPNVVTYAKLQTVAANSIIGNPTSATANAQAVATSTLYGTGTGGQVLAWNNGTLQFVATTTFSSGLAYSGGNVTNTGLLSLQQLGGGIAQTGAITFATSTTAIANDWGITNSGGTFTFNIPTATASVRGLLSSTDWTTFNGKQAALGFTPISNALAKGNFLVGNDAGVAQATSSIFVSSLGSVGIGSTTPWGQLSVNPNALGSGVPELVVGSTSATHFVIDGAGRVGIGTTSPMSALALNSGVLTVPAGAVAVPSYTFTSDVDTGMWSPAANTLAFSTGGSERMRVASDGTILINTTTLQSGYKIVFNGSSYFSGSNANFQLAGLKSGGNSWLLQSVDSDGRFRIYDNTVALTDVFTIAPGGNTGIGSTTPWAQLGVSTTTGNYTGQTMFSVTNNTNATLFNVLGNGNVGVGTTKPLGKFYVGPSTTLDNYQGAQIGIAIAGTGSGSWLELANDGSSATRSRINYDSTNSAVIFENNGKQYGWRAGSYTGSYANSQMVLTTGGLLGIGTTTPISTLTVNGHVGTDGLAPALTLCGTSPAITTGSTDTAGTITEGTIATGCVITFKTAYARAPFCTVVDQAGLAFSYVLSATAITITNIGALSSTNISYACIANDL